MTVKPVNRLKTALVSESIDVVVHCSRHDGVPSYDVSRIVGTPREPRVPAMW